MSNSPDSKREALLNWLAAGCDERVIRHPQTGDIKYHLDPLGGAQLHYRGSCTAGVLTEDVYPAALEAVDRIERGSMAGWADEQRRRIEELVPTGVPFDTFFAPSGTDLLYYPLLFARTLSTRPILNLLSCPEELGSGSRHAVSGQFFSERAANGQALQPGKPVHQGLLGEVIEMQARSEDGRIRNRHDDIHQLLDAHTDKQVIVHLVFGSKSGIKDDLDIIAHRPNVMWTVDLCQFRADPELIGRLLGQGVLVLITGSKFYHAPPFCGALLAPKSLGDRLVNRVAEAASGLAPVLAQSDLPERYASFRSMLPMEENPGSRLRWECALHEMEAISAYPRSEVDAAIREWNEEVGRLLGHHAEFELIPDQAKTNDSIISFRIKSAGRYLNKKEMQAVHRIFCTADWSAQGLFKRVFIGQPVTYGERSFLRVALGSRGVRHRLSGGDTRAEDALMLDLLAQTSRDFMAS